MKKTWLWYFKNCHVNIRKNKSVKWCKYSLRVLIFGNWKKRYAFWLFAVIGSLNSVICCTVYTVHRHLLMYPKRYILMVCQRILNWISSLFKSVFFLKCFTNILLKIYFRYRRFQIVMLYCFLEYKTNLFVSWNAFTYSLCKKKTQILLLKQIRHYDLPHL